MSAQIIKNLKLSADFSRKKNNDISIFIQK